MFNDSSPHGTKGGIVNLRQILLGIAISSGLTLATVSHAQNWHSKKLRTPTSTSADTTAPTTPSGLAASAVTSTSLTLSWNASTDNVGVTGYQVYLNGTLVASPGGASASISGLSASTPYSFTVSALDAAGNVSAQSSALSVTTPSAALSVTTLPQGSANLLFSSGFESLTVLSPPSNFFGSGAWQDIVGADSTSGFTWPPNIWGGGPTHFQMIVSAPVDATNIGNYIFNQIQTVTGHKGTPTRALYQQITQKGGSYIQDVLMLQPASEQGDLYISFWMKFQPDLLAKMTPQNWRALFEWKTAGDDYRMIAGVYSWDDGCGGNKPNGALFWRLAGDRIPDFGLPYLEFWRVDNCSNAVPVDQWFKFEVFWHRSSGADGRVWMAVNGQVIADHYGSNKGVNNAPINRIFMPNLYSDTPYPIYQWIDDVEIWDGFPPVTGNNPPYAPH